MTPQIQHRTFRVRFAATDTGDEIEASLASDVPVYRPSLGADEVLSFAPGAVNLERAVDGLPVLLQHAPDRLAGRASKVRIEGGRLRGKLKFFDTVDGREASAIVSGGHREMSIGYAINETTRRKDGSYLVTRWTPYEASIVSIPADPRVGIQRHTEPTMNTHTQDHLDTVDLTDAGDAAAPATRSQRRAAERATEAERERVGTLIAIGESFRAQGLDKLAADAVREGTTVEAFRSLAMQKLSSAAPANADIGMPAFIQRHHNYSLARAVQSMTDPAGFMRQSGFEREMSQELQRSSRIDSPGLLVPMSAVFGGMHRRLQQRGMLTSGAGGASVDAVIDSTLFADVLRATSIVVALGARVMPGLSSDLAVPRKTAATSAGWVTEVAAVSSSDPTFDNITMLPKRIGAYTDVSRRLVIQSSLDLESLVQSDLAQTILLEQDRVAMLGTGASNQPTGIGGTASIGTVVGGTNGLALTYAHVLEFESDVASANGMVDVASCGYAINPSTRSKLKRTVKIPGEIGDPIMGDEVPDAAGLLALNGYRCGVSTALPSNGTKGTGTNLSTIIFGDWSQLMIGQWGNGVELLVDPYTLATTGQVRITANLFADVAVRHPQSFSVMTDAITV